MALLPNEIQRRVMGTSAKRSGDYKRELPLTIECAAVEAIERLSQIRDSLPYHRPTAADGAKRGSNSRELKETLRQRRHLGHEPL